MPLKMGIETSRTGLGVSSSYWYGGSTGFRGVVPEWLKDVERKVIHKRGSAMQVPAASFSRLWPWFQSATPSIFLFKRAGHHLSFCHGETVASLVRKP